MITEAFSNKRYSYFIKTLLHHSHKKQKDSLESSLDRVLLAVELEFWKILVPRLLQDTSDVNIKFAGKSE